MMNCLAATFFHHWAYFNNFNISPYIRYIIGNKVSGVHSKKYFWQTLQNFLVIKQNSLFLPYDLYEGGERICLFFTIIIFLCLYVCKGGSCIYFCYLSCFFSTLRPFWRRCSPSSWTSTTWLSLQWSSTRAGVWRSHGTCACNPSPCTLLPRL